MPLAASILRGDTLTIRRSRRLRPIYPGPFLAIRWPLCDFSLRWPVPGRFSSPVGLLAKSAVESSPSSSPHSPFCARRFT